MEGVIPSTIKCPSCGTTMLVETHAGVDVDRCPFCDALWFDATELDRHLQSNPTITAHPAWERTIPNQGISGWSCPRCKSQELESAGWSTLVLDRCPSCHGIFLDAAELKMVDGADVNKLAPSFEQTLLSIGHSVGNEFVGGKDFFSLLGRVLDSVRR